VIQNTRWASKRAIYIKGLQGEQDNGGYCKKASKEANKGGNIAARCLYLGWSKRRKEEVLN
jgi:hypothetical protein